MYHFNMYHHNLVFILNELELAFMHDHMRPPTHVQISRLYFSALTILAPAQSSDRPHRSNLSLSGSDAPEAVYAYQWGLFLLVPACFSLI